MKYLYHKKYDKGCWEEWRIGSFLIMKHWGFPSGIIFFTYSIYWGHATRRFLFDKTWQPFVKANS